MDFSHKKRELFSSRMNKFIIKPVNPGSFFVDLHEFDPLIRNTVFPVTGILNGARYHLFMKAFFKRPVISYILVGKDILYLLF